MDVFPGGTPTKDLLDAVVPDRIVFLPNRDGHSAWVNSRALEVAGITATTPDPADGRIERDADGEPSGTLHEGAADLVGRLAPAVDAGRGVRRACSRASGTCTPSGSRRGRTRSCPPTTGWTTTPPTSAPARPATSPPAWSARSGGTATAATSRSTTCSRLRERGRAGRFAATSVKIMQDGVCETFTAAVLEPYLDADGNATDEARDLLRGPGGAEGLRRPTLDGLGFQVHFHALAERAVRESLDAIEAALEANGPNDHRHHLAHLQVVHPDDVPRFRRLRAVANAQPLWAAHEGQMDDLTIPFLGEPRWRWQYPFGSLVRSGAGLAMGSDWSVSSPDPLEEIHVAVNRVMPRPRTSTGTSNTDVFLPDERLDLATAIAAFTMGSAYVNHLDDVTGSIEVGKYADLAVVDRDLFAHPVEEIANAQVDATFVEGVPVYRAHRRRLTSGHPAWLPGSDRARTIPGIRAERMPQSSAGAAGRPPSERSHPR